jgi:hypothetical protein
MLKTLSQVLLIEILSPSRVKLPKRYLRYISAVASVRPHRYRYTSMYTSQDTYRIQEALSQSSRLQPCFSLHATERGTGRPLHLYSCSGPQVVPRLTRTCFKYARAAASKCAQNRRPKVQNPSKRGRAKLSAGESPPARRGVRVWHG